MGEPISEVIMSSTSAAELQRPEKRQELLGTTISGHEQLAKAVVPNLVDVMNHEMDLGRRCSDA